MSYRLDLLASGKLRERIDYFLDTPTVFPLFGLPLARGQRLPEIEIAAHQHADGSAFDRTGLAGF